MKRFALLCSLLLLAAVGIWSVAAQEGQGRAFLGVTVTQAEKGAQVENVQPGSPADQAGIRVDDLIVQVAGQAVTADNLRAELAKHAAGDTITLSVLRGAETVDLEVRLAERPNDARQEPQFGRANPEQPRLGVRLEETDKGVVIREVVADSAAAKAGLKVGDIVKKVGDTTVENARAVVEAIRSQNVGDTIAIEVEREGKTETVNVTLEAAPGQPFPQGMEQMFSLRYDPSARSWSIGNISEGNPLYDAGLRAGDVITQFDGKAYDPAELHAYLQGLTDVKEVTLTIERGSETQEIKVPLEAISNFGMFGFGGQMFEMPFGEMMQGGRLGVEFLTLDEQIAQERNLQETEGALVTQVLDDTPAAKAGLKENDVITAVNGDKLDAERTLRDRLSAYEPGDTVKLDVKRGSESLQVEVTLEQMAMPDMFAPFFDRDGHGFQFQFPPDFQFQLPPDQQSAPVAPNI